MQELNKDLKKARVRIGALVEIMRWTWVVNSIVLILSLFFESYWVTALAGFTLLMSFTAAAVARRVWHCLGEAQTAAGAEQARPELAVDVWMRAA